MSAWIYVFQLKDDLFPPLHLARSSCSFVCVCLFVCLFVSSPPVQNARKVEKFRRSLREIKDISKFKSLDKSLVHEMDKVFSGDIPKLMEKAARPRSR